MIKEKIPHDNPVGIQGFVFNIRKPLFADPKVRQALIYAFDFEWLNKTLAYGQYTRTRSWFQNSEMEAKGMPSPEELEILNPLEGPDPAGGFHHRVQPARDRWLRQRARQPRQGVGAAGRGRLEGRERQAGQGRQDLPVRVHGR